MAGLHGPFSVDSANWQDYRASATGMLVYYGSDPVSEIPIREVPEDAESTVPPEPNYESGTYGLYSCSRPKVRTAFVKNKARYLFFSTKYCGTNPEYTDKIIVTGYYHVVKTADARKFHIRYCREYECLDVSNCTALQSDVVHFVSLADAFVITDEVLKEWHYSARVNRQTRILLDAGQTSRLVEYLSSKPNAVRAYLDETRRLLPHELADALEGDEEEPAEAEEEATVNEPDAAAIAPSAEAVLAAEQAQVSEPVPEDQPGAPTPDPDQYRDQ